MRIIILIIFLITGAISCQAAENQLIPAVTQSISINDIAGYASYPDNVKKIILQASELSEKNLTYLYGSSDPKNGGMDCSGTIYYLLKNSVDSHIPRDSNEMYEWVKRAGKIYYAVSPDLQADVFKELKPGDLLFWSGTYENTKSNYITHVMLYLGKNLKNEPLMFGSSNGRTYQGKKMWGVSVFDFKLPNGKTKARFVAFGCIPSFTC